MKNDGAKERKCFMFKFGSSPFHIKKTPALPGVSIFSGERGIRTPGPLRDNGFQDRRIRPLCHFSVCKTITKLPLYKE